MPYLPVRRWELLLAAAVVCLTVGIDGVFVGLDGAVPREDAPARIAMSAAQYHHGVSFEHGFPPVTFTLSSWMYTVFGPGVRVAVASMLPWKVLFIGSAWWLGRVLAGRRGGLVMGVVAAGFPWMAVHVRSYFTDVPLTAAVALAFAALVASRNYTRGIPVVVLGLAAGLGLMSRWSFAFFMAVPLVMAALPALRQPGVSRRLLGATVGLLVGSGLIVVAAAKAPGWVQVLVVIGLTAAWGGLVLVAARWWSLPGGRTTGAGLTIAAGFAAVACAWWYVPSAGAILFKATSQMDERAQVVPASRFVGNLVTILQSWWLFPAWAAAGVVASVVVRELRWPAALAAGGLLSGYLLSSWIAPEAPRYLMPGCIFALAIAFPWLGRLRLAPAAAGVLGLVGLVQVGFWVHPGRVPGWAMPVGLFTGAHVYEWAAVPVTGAPVREAWDLLPAVQRAAALGPGVATIVESSRSTIRATLEPHAFDMVAALADVPLNVRHETDPGVREVPRFIVVSGRPLSPSDPPQLPWYVVARWVECWQSVPAEGGTSRSYWCLFDAGPG